MADDAWSVAEAKAKFSELVERARTEGPQHITRNGRDAVVVVSAEEWAKRRREPKTILEYLENSPLKGSGLVIERDPDIGRVIEFD
ncbi:MAG TPA: type II toxin-antitoxin system Phd/YefM family antitoxin [Caulobacteraceae bacterium]|nr:type II toxin-antitoxin system Phd/YefM family antitoxin [Caulobacteraceae bacterium]